MSGTARQPGWPPPGADVELVDGAGEVLLAARAGTPVDDTTLPCAPHRSARPEELPAPASTGELRWSEGAALWTRAVQVARVRAGVLTLVAAGPATATQRRRFFRAPVTLDVEIDHDGVVTTATACDLSEGGARVRADGPLPLPHTPVTARVRMQGAEVAVPATVVRAAADGRVREVGVAFGDVPVPAADAIRRQVLEAQVAPRRIREEREERG